MLRGARRDLRAMGDGQDLQPVRPPREPGAERIGNGTTNTCVDLVADERGGGARRRGAVRLDYL